MGGWLDGWILRKKARPKPKAPNQLPWWSNLNPKFNERSIHSFIHSIFFTSSRHFKINKSQIFKINEMFTFKTG